MTSEMQAREIIVTTIITITTTITITIIIITTTTTNNNEYYLDHHGNCDLRPSLNRLDGASAGNPPWAE